MKSALFKYVGLRHLISKPSRTVLTTLGVAFGVALFVAIQIINRSTLASFQESIDAMAGKSKLTVSAGQAGFPEDRIEIIQKIAGVKQAVPMVETHAYIADDTHSTETLVVLGVDLLKEQGVRTYKTTDEQVIDDPLVFLNQPDSIIVTHAFATTHKLKIDDKFNIATAHGIKTMVVRGMLTPEGPARAYGGSVAIMDIDGARMTFGKENKLDRIDIVTKDGENIDDLAGRLQDTLGAGYHVERPQTQSENKERLVKSFQSLLSFFSTLALLVGLFLVTNSVSISVAERKREIGTLRALGSTRAGILALFLSEATAMGILGSFLGVWMGRGLSSILIGMVSKSISTQYMTPIRPSHLLFGPIDMFTGIAIGAGAAMVAALWPSLKATSIQPLEAMKRTESNDQSSSFFGFSLYLGLAMMIYFALSSYNLWGIHYKVFEILNRVSSMVGSALVGPSLVALLLYIFRSVFIRMGGTITRLAEDNMLRNPKRTGSNVMSLMVGLILVIIISTMNTSFKSSIMTWFDRVLRADILVSSYGKISTYQVQPIHEDLGWELAKLPGVAQGRTDGGTFGFRFIHVQYGGKQLGMKSYDEPGDKNRYKMFDVQDRSTDEAGYDLFHSKENAVLVSENFQLHFKKKTGDSITLETPSGRADFKIVGIIVDFASPEGVMYIDRAVYKRLWRDNLVDGFGLRVMPGYTVDQVRRSIDQQFGRSKNLQTMSNAELRASILQDVDESFAYTRAIEAAALLVGLLGLLNTFLISVMERTRELGMLRAVGMSRAQMRSMILQEAIVQGGFGAVVAVALGGWTAYLWISTTLSYVLGWIVRFSFPWAGIFTTIFVGILVTVIAGIYPARRAANIEIREALEYE